MILKLIYIVALVALSIVAVAQEIGNREMGKGKREESLPTSQFPLPTSQHDLAVAKNRKMAKKLKAQHRREFKRKQLKRDKRDVLKPRFKPRPKYQPGRVSRPVVE